VVDGGRTMATMMVVEVEVYAKSIDEEVSLGARYSRREIP